MSNAAEQVTQFREVVETAIENSIYSHPGEWPAMNYVEINKLQYMSVNPKDIRLSSIGSGSEHRWGIVSRLQPIDRYMGRVALVSLEGLDEMLIRRVNINSPRGPFFVIESERELADMSELDLALNWARSPDHYPRNLVALGELTSREQEKVALQHADLSRAAIDPSYETMAIRRSLR
jgi:hypothetical protein